MPKHKTAAVKARVRKSKTPSVSAAVATGYVALGRRQDGTWRWLGHGQSADEVRVIAANVATRYILEEVVVEDVHVLATCDDDRAEHAKYVLGLGPRPVVNVSDVPYEHGEGKLAFYHGLTRGVRNIEDGADTGSDDADHALPAGRRARQRRGSTAGNMKATDGRDIVVGMMVKWTGKNGHAETGLVTAVNGKRVKARRDGYTKMSRILTPPTIVDAE